jgi:hypothetical protein
MLASYRARRRSNPRDPGARLPAVSELTCAGRGAPAQPSQGVPEESPKPTSELPSMKIHSAA